MRARRMITHFPKLTVCEGSQKICHEWISAGIGLGLVAFAVALATGDRTDLINCLLAGTILLGIGVWAGANHGQWHD